MVSGLQFVETILFWIGTGLLFSAFVSACMESRRSDDVDLVRTWLGSKFDQVGRVPTPLILVATLRMLRNAIDRLVSELITDFDVSSLSAPIVMAVLSVMLPLAAAINALLGGSAFLVTMYLSIALAFFVLGFAQENRISSLWLGLVSVAATFAALAFGPFYAFQSLTNHILTGTFSHSVLGSVLVAVLLYAGCAGTWLLYRAMRTAKVLSSVDRSVARFLFAVPGMYILYWFGLLAGHFAVNDPSPIRGWIDLASVVVVGAISFAAVVSTIELGVLEKRRGHGLAVILATGVVSLIGVVAINGLVAQELPFWLRFWQYGFSTSDIVLGSQFWSTHSPFFLWMVMILSILFILVVRVVLVIWPGGATRLKERPFLALSGISVIGAMIVFAGRSLLTFT